MSSVVSNLQKKVSCGWLHPTQNQTEPVISSPHVCMEIVGYMEQ